MELLSNIVIFIFGASIGSFLNVLIDRLPNDESINGRSHCDFCGKKLNWYDMFPVISFFILGGKTRCCKKKLSFQYPLVEMITGISFLLITNYQIPITKQLSIINLQYSNFWMLNNWNLFVTWLLFLGISSCLIVIFVSDLKYQLISDYILLSLFVLSVLFRLGSGNPTPTTIYNYLQPFITNHIPSGLIVCLPIFLIYFISRERAMGLGDVYLSAIMGFLLGWQAGFIALYIAFVTGAIFGLFVIIFKNKKLKSKIAFGPFLVIGTIIMLFWGEKILEIIKKIYG
jgi:prepilin signal peptidase PulO-like enzyme (type II secretory pathway)